MIKILTLNVNTYSTSCGPWPVRIGLIRELLENTCPDVIALQAVRREPGQYQGEDQAEQISSLTNLYRDIYFQPAMCFPGDVVEGDAILSRLSIIERDYRNLSLLEDEEDNLQRVIQHAQLKLDAGWLHLFNTELSWSRKQAAVQMREILEEIGDISGPALLAGDFNLNPEDTALEPLREHGWVDLWSQFYPRQDGFTFFESGEMVKRIDYAWANAELLPRVLGIKIVADESAGLDVRPSDHAGLLVSMDLNRGDGLPCP